MKVQVLVSTMKEDPYNFSCINHMNIKGDCLVCNQSSVNRIVESEDGKQVIFTTQGTGVGRSRNLLLLQSDADICVLADDDMIFKDDYESIVLDIFSKHPEADIIAFNIDNIERLRYSATTSVTRFNYAHLGAARIAFRRKAILEHHIFFSLLFGGGTKYGSGEDTIFLRNCLDAKLTMIGVNESIARIEESRESTWFTGFNEKYFFDKGALYYVLDRKIFYLQAFQYCIRKKKLAQGNLSSIEIFKLMCAGRNAIKSGKSYDEFMEFTR